MSHAGRGDLRYAPLVFALVRTSLHSLYHDGTKAAVRVIRFEI